MFFWKSKLSHHLPRFKHGYPGNDLSGGWNVRGRKYLGDKISGEWNVCIPFHARFWTFFWGNLFSISFFGLLVYSKTSQNGHPLGNAKLAVLQRWPSYGNTPFMNNRWVNMFGRVSDRSKWTQIHWIKKRVFLKSFLVKIAMRHFEISIFPTWSSSYFLYWPLWEVNLHYIFHLGNEKVAVL